MTLRETAQALCDAIEQADRRADSRGGQQCAPSCDFAYVSPSTRRELRWWATRLREAINEEAGKAKDLNK